MTEFPDNIHHYGVTEWIRKIYNEPMKQMNYLISTFIRLFLNAYSDKLFKIDDKIIDRNEHNDIHNIFYLCPIQINESILHFGLNTLKINSGEIIGMVISVPVFGGTAENSITVDTISINASLDQINSTSSTILMSQYVTHTDINENNLSEILKKTKEIILQYFNTIHCNINKITINIRPFIITLSEITINDQTFSFKRIHIDGLLTISNLIYQSSSKFLSIDQLHISTELYQLLPEIYIEKSDSTTFNCQCQINLCMIDKIHINGISILFGDEIVCQRINLIDFDGSAIVNEISPFVIKEGNIILQGRNFITINNRARLTEIIKNINDVCSVSNKIITVSLVESIIQPTRVHGINLVVIERDLLIVVDIGIYRKNDLYDINLKIGPHSISVDQIIISETVEFNNVNITSATFNATVKKIIYYDNKISFYDGSVNEITELIKNITEIIGKFTDKSSNPNPKKIMLHFRNINIVHQVDNLVFHLLVKSLDADVTENIISNVMISLFNDDYLIGTLEASLVSEKKIIIDIVKFYFDPNIFDNVSYLFGILSNKNNQEMMTSAVVAESLNDLESIIRSRSVHFARLFQMGLSSIHQLHSVIMDNYKPNNMEKIFTLQIGFLCVYLFDNLVKYSLIAQTKESPFLSISLKGIEFKKYLDETYAYGKLIPQGMISGKYGLKIPLCAVADLKASCPKQKYFLKNTYQDGAPFLRIITTIDQDQQQARITMAPITVHINEETLFHILNFFSHQHQMPEGQSGTNFTKLVIDQIDLTINYYPIIMNQNLLSLQNFKLSLKPQKIQEISSIQNIYEYLIAAWKKDINPFRFIPSLNIIQPLTTPIMQIYYFIQKYFANPSNKKIIRELIKQLSTGASLAPMMLRNGFNQLSDFLS